MYAHVCERELSSKPENQLTMTKVSGQRVLPHGSKAIYTKLSMPLRREERNTDNEPVCR